MTDPMSHEELRACRERYGREAGRTLRDAAEYHGTRAHGASFEIRARYQTAVENARADVPRLLATIAARDEEIAALQEQVDRLDESASMACITPADDCQCSGCLYAAEVNERDEEEGQ